MSKKRRTRKYRKGQRWYADFRDFRAVGGGQEALKPPGSRMATTDPDMADTLVAERLKELQELAERRKSKALVGLHRESGLAAYADRHLRLKTKVDEGEESERKGPVKGWMIQAERHLLTACAFFGPDADLATIAPDDLTHYVKYLRGLPNGRGGTLSDSSVRKYLNSLSNLFRRAVSERYAKTNPVADMFSKPTEKQGEARYLKREEAALLLEAARTYTPAPPKTQPHGGSLAANANPYLYPILATFVLTGLRKSECLGLEVDDVNLRGSEIRVRPNRHRRLKTKRSKRSVPLWPQLREILTGYLIERERDGGLGALLFPSNRGGRGESETMIRDLRKSLDRISARAGISDPVRLHVLRHTYTAARLQTLDRGAPVAPYTVARELGHSSTGMIEERYGHPYPRPKGGDPEVVEFRIEHHRDDSKPPASRSGIEAKSP